MIEKKRFAQVAVGLPIDEVFTYLVPPYFQEEIKRGMRVFVPFGKRQITGYVADFVNNFEGKEIKSIIEILDDKPTFDEDMLLLTKWVSDYYFSPWGEVLKAASPKGLDMKSYRFVMLSNEGKEQLDKGLQKKGREKEILELLRPVKKLKLNQLIKKTGLKGITPYLVSLQEQGLIRVENLKEGSTRIHKKEKFVKPASWISNIGQAKSLCKGAPSQTRCLDILFKEGEVRMSDLRKDFKGFLSIFTALQKKGLVEVFDRDVNPDPAIDKGFPKEEFLKLNSYQKKALESIIEGIDSNRFSPYLLHGITGSGKTEVYLHAISYMLNKGKNALFLVPEISLTPQLVGRFRRRFGGCIALFHSGLSVKERLLEWDRVRNDQASIVIGTRSAVFLPTRNLGIIIIDEEHDSSYKQDETPRYHGRDVALVRARNAGATVVLGSATPSLESFYNSKTGKYSYLSLPTRIEKRPLPEVQIIDLAAIDKKEKAGYLASALEEAIRERLKNKEQVLLFLNRRGFASFLMCRDCGHVFKCLNCSVSLTYHSGEKKGRCHYCGFSVKLPDTCPECNGAKIESFGMGTQRVEDELKKLFCDFKIARMDRDTTRKKDSHEMIFQKIKNREIDILIGTQMITKGHDYPNITLVGVISADGSLNVPDFRSGERTFQLLNQVAGRAGRGELKGKVIIQTFNPEHYSILYTKEHDYKGFYEREIAFRKALNYPPFSKLAVIKMDGHNKERVCQSINRLRDIFVELTKKQENIDILGPSKGVPAKVKNRYRWMILLKGKEISSLHRTIQRGISRLHEANQSKGVNVGIDIDPIRIF
jgi:primosomal protein N' (replication factor Y) (superfamily II helicase)